MKIGYQLFSARDAVQKDFLGTLKQLKTMGYEEVEFAGFYGKTADEVKAMLTETGLQAVSSHVALDTLLEDTDGQIAFHKKIGTPYIAVPWLYETRRPGNRDFARTIRDIQLLGEKMADSGITLLYHNHDFEFETVSGRNGLDFLYEAIDPRYLQAELDTCWVNVAGYDVVDYIEKYVGRCPVLHLKDFVGSKENNERLRDLIGTADGKKKHTEFAFRPFGYGEQPVGDILRAAAACRIVHLVVEQDNANELDPLDAAEMSIGTIEKFI